MDRYEECLRHVRSYVDGLRLGGIRPELLESRVRSFVERPAYDVTFRAALIAEALR